MVPQIVMQFAPKNRLLKALSISLPTTVKPLALITLKNRTLNPVAGVFAQQLRATAKRLTRRPK
jgi:DNA-binding transcriptional LysR family regulator